MPTKDRLHEIRNTSTNDEDTNSLSDNNSNIVSNDDQEILHHVIGSGGRLADFFDKVEQVSMAIDSVKKNVDEVEDKQREMLETDWESHTADYLANTQIMNKRVGLEGNSVISFDRENVERNNQKDFKHIS